MGILHLADRKQGVTFIVAREEFRRANKLGDLIARFGASSVTFNNLDTACIFLGLNLAETRRTLEQLRSEIRSLHCAS